MSFLLAEQEHWYKQEGTVHSDDHDLTINFKVCGGLDDLRNGVKTESVDTYKQSNNFNVVVSCGKHLCSNILSTKVN